MRTTQSISLLGVLPVAVLVITALAVGNNGARAGMITLVNDRSDLGADDFIDFDPLGDDGDTLTNPLSLTSQSGAIVDVVVSQGPTLGTFNGLPSVFGEGEHSFAQPSGFAPITVRFEDGPVAAFGADFFASLSNAQAFSETVELRVLQEGNSGPLIFDLAGGPISGQPENDNPTFSGFVGVTSTEADISQIQFGLHATNPFADSITGDLRLEMNRVDFSETVGSSDSGTGGSSNPVPEPSSLALLGFGGLALAGYGWRRRKRRFDTADS